MLTDALRRMTPESKGKQISDCLDVNSTGSNALQLGNDTLNNDSNVMLLAVSGQIPAVKMNPIYQVDSKQLKGPTYSPTRSLNMIETPNRALMTREQ
jgi:hypothetical protein